MVTCGLNITKIGFVPEEFVNELDRLELAHSRRISLREKLDNIINEN